MTLNCLTHETVRNAKATASKAKGKRGKRKAKGGTVSIGNRPLGDDKKVGILHVKCAVADGEWLVLSSVNLTQQAFTINMELGMLFRGGSMPSRVVQQFDRLIQSGQLKQVGDKLSWHQP